jgi:hypothetical protein
MNCEEARLHIGAEPQSSTPELEAHLQGCVDCTRFREEMTALDTRIGKVMQSGPQVAVAAPAPAPAPATVTALRPRRVGPVWSGWAMAASVLVAAVATLAIWALYPTNSLAHEVVTHVEGEPASWGSTTPVAGPELDTILRASGVQLAMDSRRVVYAQSCDFRGHHVPHLVVQTSRGPVTVMVLRHEHVRARKDFHEDGMSGVLMPAPHGSIAVLAKGDTNLDEVADQLRTNVRWLD